jgi:ADP-ribosylglycohydrolase
VEITLRDRIRGCLLGGAVGDALGAGVEFSSLAEIRSRHGATGVTGYVPAYGDRFGTITDDTQMTAFTVEGLLRAAVRSDRGVVNFPLAIWFAYQRWLVTQGETPVLDPAPPDGVLSGWLLEEPDLQGRRAPGATCLTGLLRPGMDTPLPPSCATSKGCGTVMRSAPFGLFAKPWVRAEHAAGLAAECSYLTHGHPTAAHASAALAWTVRELADGRPLREAVAAAQAYLDGAGPDAAETAAALRAATVPGLGSGPDPGFGPPQPEEVEALGGGWIAEEALAIAVRCAMAAEDGAPGSVRAALLAAVNHGGDSDSTGSLCGQLLGAAFGDQALPPEWVVEVEGRGVLLQLADDLFYEVTRSEDLHGDHGPHTRWRLRYPGY